MTSVELRSQAAVGVSIIHRRYVDHSRARYGGGLVDGGYVMGLFGDIATDLSLQVDADEGLLAGYSEVTFHSALQAGDVLELIAKLVRVGTRSRTVSFEARALARTTSSGAPSRGQILEPPLLIASATGTVVVPA